MAAPTPSTSKRQVGHTGVLIWKATWATTDNLSDAAVLDLSALSYTNQIIVERVVGWHSTGISLTLEFDDDSADELVLHSPEGHVETFDVDFTLNGLQGIGYAGSGGTGDLVITTAGAASADEIYLVIYYRNT